MSSFDQQTRQLEYLVEHTRRRLRRNAVVTGVALLEIAAIGWLLVAASVDLLLPLADWLRWVVWGGFWLVVAAVAGAWVIWPALRPMPMQRVAAGRHRRKADFGNSSRDLYLGTSTGMSRR
jgi:type VI protein secretion system component VasK